LATAERWRAERKSSAPPETPAGEAANDGGWKRDDVHFTAVTKGLNESEPDRFRLLGNGSLMITKAMRGDTGFYHCTASNRRGNFTTTVELLLDYAIMSIVMRTSFIVGFISAAAFFSIAALLGLVRYLAHVCSAEERAKRRSLRELLTQIRSGSHVDRLSAYRTAKMDQFAAFKSATMDQLSSFKTERIGRLRKYKQATVSAVLHQLERMREHYAAQTARVKESYAQNVERLRENYALQRARFQDRRSVSVHHIRKQYRARAERAREYSVSQVARLREQYKQQQQYFLKLLELIDVGSCVSQAVEVECMRAESAIFDAGAMAFDEEARPSHATRGDESLLFETASLPDGFPVLREVDAGAVRGRRPRPTTTTATTSCRRSTCDCVRSRRPIWATVTC
jgi:DNA-binding transcriptional regulator YiaG